MACRKRARTRTGPGPSARAPPARSAKTCAPSKGLAGCRQAERGRAGVRAAQVGAARRPAGWSPSIPPSAPARPAAPRCRAPGSGRPGRTHGTEPSVLHPRPAQPQRCVRSGRETEASALRRGGRGSVRGRGAPAPSPQGGLHHPAGPCRAERSPGLTTGVTCPSSGSGPPRGRSRAHRAAQGAAWRRDRAAGAPGHPGPGPAQSVPLAARALPGGRAAGGGLGGRPRNFPPIAAVVAGAGATIQGPRRPEEGAPSSACSESPPRDARPRPCACHPVTLLSSEPWAGVRVALMPSGTVGGGGGRGSSYGGWPFPRLGPGLSAPIPPQSGVPTNPRRGEIPKGGVVRCLGCWHLLQERRSSPEPQNQAQEVLTWDLETWPTLKLKPGEGAQRCPTARISPRGGSGE